MPHFIVFFFYIPPCYLKTNAHVRLQSRPLKDGQNAPGSERRRPFIPITDVRKHPANCSRSFVAVPARQIVVYFRQKREEKTHSQVSVSVEGQEGTGSRSPSFSAERVVLSPRSHSAGSKVTPVHLLPAQPARPLSKS